MLDKSLPMTRFEPRMSGYGGDQLSHNHCQLLKWLFDVQDLVGRESNFKCLLILPTRYRTDLTGSFS